MSDIDQRISDLVNGFVAEITRLAREAAVNTLQAALAGSGGPMAGGDSRGGGRGRGGARGGRAGAAVGGGGGGGALPSSASSSRRPKGAKRPADEIAQTKERVWAHIKANPGQRIEQINKELGTRTSDLSLPLKKLLSEGAIRTEGSRRATKYFPGDGSGGGGGGGARGRGRGGRKKKS